MTLTALNQALLSALLPAGAEGRAVLLGCDDLALHGAVTAAGLDAGDPVRVLRATLRAAAPVRRDSGIEGLLRALPAARRGDTPSDLALLCACVLAASRMSPDERHSTHAYYARLGEVLDVPLRATHPAVAGFEAIPGRFDALAVWMTGPQAGRRGRLIIPEEPWPRLVGVPISQAPLRAVDRDRLDVLFAAHGLALDLGRDPLRVLASHPVRHTLTAPAQRLMDDPPLHDTLRAALEAAYRAWDGTVADDRGRRVHAARLRLGLTPGRMTLNLRFKTAQDDLTARGPGGVTVTIPSGGEGVLDLKLLAAAAGGPVDLAAPRRRRVRALPGPVLLFEPAHDGYWLTAAADSDPVIVLTCRPDLAGGDWGPRRARVPLPDGWALICDVDPSELPNELRLAERAAAAAGRVWLQGGLTLERRDVWLLDHPPLLCSIDSEPQPVSWHARGGAERDIGEVSAEQPLALDILADQPGVHHVIVGDRELVVELAEQGLRTGVGQLAHRPAAAALARSGAVSATDPALFGDPTPVVCGALVVGAPPPTYRPPLLIRARGGVQVIYRDGTVRPAPPATHPQWARQSGLPPTAGFEIPDPDQAVWLCVISRRHRRVIALTDADVPDTDDVLDLAEAFADAPVIDRSPGGAQPRWQRLVDAALEEPVDA